VLCVWQCSLYIKPNKTMLDRGVCLLEETSGCILSASSGQTVPNRLIVLLIHFAPSRITPCANEKW